jgi:short subunit dehydrogenase-like uncharacterized protein
VRKDGRITSVPLAYKTRRIDFGNGEKLAMIIPWGDVSNATAGIPNIEVYIPGSPAMVAWARRAHRLKWLLGTGIVQNFMKRRIEKTVKGPSVAKRDAQPAFVWGEVTNAQGDNRTAQIKTANGYSLTVTGALAVVEHDPCLLNYTACGDGPHMRPRTARQSSPDQGRLPPIAVSEEA